MQRCAVRLALQQSRRSPHGGLETGEVLHLCSRQGEGPVALAGHERHVHSLSYNASWQKPRAIRGLRKRMVPPSRTEREGTVMGGCFERHRHEEFLKFLRQIDRETPPERQLHLVVDNYATHKHPKVQTWLKRHPRFHLHFTPTSSSWLNLVERWFGEITRKRIRRGSFKSVKDLIEAIQDYIRHNNQDPKPFVWTKRVDQILEKVGHCKAATVTPH